MVVTAGVLSGCLLSEENTMPGFSAGRIIIRHPPLRIYRYR